MIQASIASITEAKKKLEKLLDAVSLDKRVVVTKYGRPIVEIVEVGVGLYQLVKYSRGGVMFRE